MNGRDLKREFVGKIREYSSQENELIAGVKVWYSFHFNNGFEADLSLAVWARFRRNLKAWYPKT